MITNSNPLPKRITNFSTKSIQKENVVPNTEINTFISCTVFFMQGGSEHKETFYGSKLNVMTRINNSFGPEQSRKILWLI